MSKMTATTNTASFRFDLGLAGSWIFWFWFTLTSSALAASPPTISVTPVSMTVTTALRGTVERVITVSNAVTATTNLNVQISADVTGHTLGPLALAAAAEEGFRPPVGRDFTQVQADAKYTADELLVRFAPGAQREDVLKAAGGGTIILEYKIVPGLCVVKLPAGMAVATALKTFNGQPGVLYAEPDYEGQFEAVPNDLRFGEQYGMKNTGQTAGTPDADIDAPEAWNKQTGSPSTIVAVCDTGIDYNNPDLAPNIWTNAGEIPGNGIDDDGNGYVDDVHGYNFADNNGNPMDLYAAYTLMGHGTHCAGILGAVGDNGIGVAGVCWNVKIMAVKFGQTNGVNSVAKAAQAIQYATQMGARVISLSWHAGDKYNQTLKDAIDAAGAANVALVCAAGNEGTNIDQRILYPSNFDSPNIISVVATTHNDKRASFSNYGVLATDIGAPGENVLSYKLFNKLEYWSGTSMATPHVAGAYALLLSANPSLTVAQVKAAMMDTVDPVLPGLCVSGGRLNLAAALARAGSPWLSVSPTNAINIVPGGSASVTASFQAGELDAGSYTGVVVFASNDPVTPSMTVPAVMVVLPDDLRITPQTEFLPVGTIGGPFRPEQSLYALTNGGPDAVTWSVAQSNTWLTVTPTGGVLPAGGSLMVTALVNAVATSLGVGAYNEVLTFSNHINGVTQKRTATLTVAVDYFTEYFDTSTNDLAYTSLTFTPDGSTNFYRACRERVVQFPTDPAGGAPLVLSNDSFTNVVLSGTNVCFYGTNYANFFVGDNGYITFGSGDTTSSESLITHFSKVRIAALFDDLNPAAGGSVSWKQLADRAAVTWLNVPTNGSANANSFQIEMFFNGVIRISLLNLADKSGVAGLSHRAYINSTIPPAFSENDLSSIRTCGPVMTLDLPASATEGDGSISGQVLLSTPATSDFIVTLSSSRPDEFTVPSSVTVLAGHSNATFTVTINDDAILDGSQTGLVIATAPDSGSESRTFTVHDSETATLTLTLPASLAETAGSVTGQVSVSVAPAAPVTVTLTSSDTTELILPATAIIAAGQTSTSFVANVVDELLIDGAQPVTVTAHVENWTDSIANLTVNDNENTNLVLIVPASVWENAGTTNCTVKISGMLPSDLVVALSSSDPTSLTVPSSTTIMAGQTTSVFTATINDNLLRNGTRKPVITVSVTGFITATGTITVNDNEPNLIWTTISSPQWVDTPFAIQLAARNVSNVVVTGYTGAPALSAIGDNPPVTVTMPANASIINGSIWSGTAQVTAANSNVRFIATDAGASLVGTSAAFSVLVRPVDWFAWSSISATQRVGAAIPVQLTALNALTNTVTTFTGSVTFQARSDTAIVSAGPTNATWTQPFASNSHDARTQVIYLNSELGGSNSFTALDLYVNSVTQPGATMSNWTIRLKHTAQSTYSSNLWESTGWTTVYQSRQHLAKTGWVRFAFTTPFDYNGTDSLLVDFSYNDTTTISGLDCRAGLIAGGPRTLFARVNSTVGDPLNWAANSPAGTLTNRVPGIRLVAGTSLPVTPQFSGSFTAGTWAGNLTLSNTATNIYLYAADALGHSGTSAVFQVVVADGDNDGMADAWEQAKGLDPDNPADAGLDYDGDGHSNLAEYLAGTDPNDSVSALTVTSAHSNLPDQFILRWSSVADKTYTIQAATNLLTGFDLILSTGILATPPSNVYTDSVNGVGMKFYRIQVE
ncbi:MAG: hypothetical protein PCFJNLEI_00540 [Verrucomicrobiae bacterium]|nr:hypothetical protein [Verrucomicrobiae bacterium]